MLTKGPGVGSEGTAQVDTTSPCHLGEGQLWAGAAQPTWAQEADAENWRQIRSHRARAEGSFSHAAVHPHFTGERTEP